MKIAIFISFGDDDLGHTKLVTHHIDTGDAAPIRQQPYRISPAVRNSINTHVQQMLDQGVIQHSVSPWAAPVVLVRKKDGSERFCVDYRKLNSITKRDSHPIPNVQDTLNCLHGTSYFSCMDFRSGYWQVEVDDESKSKTAFATHSGLFEFRKIPFGLANAPSTFQRLMHAIVRGLHYKICLVFSRTFEDHLQHLKDVFFQGLEVPMLSSNLISVHLQAAKSQTLAMSYLTTLSVPTHKKFNRYNRSIY